MSVRSLRARLERLEAKFFKRSRMAELVARFKTGDLTDEDDKEALSLDRRWPATKAALMAEWDRAYRRMQRRSLDRPKQRPPSTSDA
jgi:hypothetical protein